MSGLAAHDNTHTSVSTLSSHNAAPHIPCGTLRHSFRERGVVRATLTARSIRTFECPSATKKHPSLQPRPAHCRRTRRTANLPGPGPRNRRGVSTTLADAYPQSLPPSRSPAARRHHHHTSISTGGNVAGSTPAPLPPPPVRIFAACARSSAVVVAIFVERRQIISFLRARLKLVNGHTRAPGSLWWGT